jgi:transcriptional regulator with XRE-family HTH domain
MPIRLLRVYRIRARLSQDDLAKLIGVSQPMVSNWENGLSIDPANIAKIHRVLNTLGVLPKGLPATALEGYLEGRHP